MRLCDLPNDILLAVLRSAGRSAEDPCYEFLEYVPWMGICARLRRLARPVAYRRLFIEYDDNDDSIMSNLDLVVSSRSTGLVSHVAMHVITPEGLTHGFSRAVDLVARAMAVWPMVRTLDLITTPCDHGLGEHSLHGIDDIDDIVVVRDKLAALMPSIKSLHMHDHLPTAAAKLFYAHITCLYIGQLERVSSRYPLAIPHGVVPAMLQRVSIDHFSELGVRIYRSSQGQQRADAPDSTQSTRALAAENDLADAPVIEFPGLQSLTLVDCPFLDDSHVSAGTRPHRVCFPDVRRLHVACRKADCPLLGRAILPAQMELLSIACTWEVLALLAKRPLPVAQKLVLTVNEGRSSSQQALDSIARILDGARGSKDVVLLVNDQWLPVPPRHVLCANLSCLRVAGPTSISHMLDTIRLLPSLVVLGFSNLLLDGDQPDLAVAGAPPFKSKIAKISLRFARGHYSVVQALPVVEYVLATVPTLRQFQCRDLPGARVRDFISEASQSHPHLLAVRLDLGQ
ncbi:hypothetical protein IWQ56_001207 [Coemansia nantahalensis]|nr:hypothetical protein IWQ56_001207 [Coemansia nantahalensis]